MLSLTTAPQLLFDVNPISTDYPFPSGYTQSSEPYGFLTAGDDVYFATNGDAFVGSPWKTDGTAAGTVVLDVPDGIPDGGFFVGAPFAAFGDDMFLVGGIYNGNGNVVTGSELWITSGASGSTAWVKDIRPGPADANPREPVIFNGELYFTADDGVYGSEIWKSDGTESGTMRVTDINPLGGSSTPGDLTVFNGELYFGADDGVHGYELWKSDGTEVGTLPVKDIYVGGESVPWHLTVFNGELYFSADDGVKGVELWKTDGTETGTVRVTDLNPNGGSSNPASLTVSNGALYFTANDGMTGTELWKTDGTGTGTLRLTDINPYGGSSNPDHLIDFNENLYFTVNDVMTGNELWKTDGTIGGTARVADVTLLVGLQRLGDFAIFNDELYFYVHESASGPGLRNVELWKTDGTEGGTERVTYFTDNESSEAGRPTFLGPLYVAGDSLYFAANDGFTGIEPWIIRILTPDNLASIIEDLPSGVTEVHASATPVDIDNFLETIASLSPNGGEVIDIELQLAEGDYGGAIVDVPLGYRLTISGESGQVVFHGASPALTLQSGDLRVDDLTFVNSTDAPSVIVQGGTLIVRSSVIQETTAGAQSAIEIAGGSADLGSPGDPGGNTLEVSGLGGFVRNLTESVVPVVGNQYLIDGAFVTSEFLAVPEWMKMVVDQSSSSAELVGAFSLTVTVADATWEIGTPFPDFAVEYDGFVHDDDPGVLAGDLQFTTEANETSTVGVYSVAASGQSSNKYEITYVDGTLHVTPAIVGIDLRPASLNIDQNGAISLVIFGSSSFDTSQVALESLTFAGVSIDAFNHTLVDSNQDGRADLLLQFHASDAVKVALTQLYSDLLLTDYSGDEQYSTKQDALITLDGAFGEFGQEFQGSDNTNLFLSGNSLKSLLQDLGISA